MIEKAPPAFNIRDAVEGQAPAFDERELERVRGLIGTWLRRDVHWQAIVEPISLHDIRRWALYSVGDDNPLWCDATYAKSTIWGRNIAPPTFLYNVDTTIVAPGLPGVQWIYGGTRWRFFRPVSVEDTVRARARLVGVEEKRGGRTPRLVVQTGETIYLNQNDEVVAIAASDVLRVPRARSGQGMHHSKPSEGTTRPPYSDSEIEEIARQCADEKPRGADALYWDEVEIGGELPVLLKGPLTMVDIVAFYAGRRSVYNPLRLAFKDRIRHPRNVYVSPRTNIPVHPAAGHFDAEIAREIGMPGPYDQGWMRTNWLAHVVTDWMSDFGFVREFDVRLESPNLVNDLTRCEGTVAEKRVEGDEHLVELKLRCVNQREERTASGRALVRLPAKDIADRLLVGTRLPPEA